MKHCGVKYIHAVMQPSPPATSGTFFSQTATPGPLNTAPLPHPTSQPRPVGTSFPFSSSVNVTVLA